MFLPTKIWNRKFSLMLLSNFMTSVAFYFMITALPVYLITDLHFGKDQTGIIIAAYIFTAVLIRPFVSVIIDKFGRRTVYLSSLLLFSSLFFLYGLIESEVGLILIRIAHGVLWGILTTTGNTLILDLIPSDKRGEGLGYYGLAFTIAMAFGPLLASLIVEKTGYILLFILASSIAFVGSSLLLGLKFPAHNVEKMTLKQGLKGFISPKAIPIAFLTFLVLMPYGAVLNFIGVYCKTVPTGNTALFFLSLAIGLTFSRIFAGRKFDNQGPTLLLIISFIAIFLSFPTLVLFNSPISLVFSALLTGIGYGISFPIYQLMLNNVMPISMRSTANSLFLTAIDVGIGIGVLVMGFLSENLDIKIAFIFWSVFALIGLFYFLFAVNTHYRKSKML